MGGLPAFCVASTLLLIFLGTPIGGADNKKFSCFKAEGTSTVLRVQMVDMALKDETARQTWKVTQSTYDAKSYLITRQGQPSIPYHYYVICYSREAVEEGEPTVEVKGLLYWREEILMELSLLQCDQSVWKFVVPRKVKSKKHRVLVHYADSCAQYYRSTFDPNDIKITICPWNFSLDEAVVEVFETEMSNQNSGSGGDGLTSADESTANNLYTNTDTVTIAGLYDYKMGPRGSSSSLTGRQPKAAASGEIKIPTFKTTSTVKSFIRKTLRSDGNDKSQVAAVFTTNFELYDRCYRNDNQFQLRAEWQAAQGYWMGATYVEYHLYCYTKTPNYQPRHAATRSASNAQILGIFGFEDELLLEIEAADLSCDRDNIYDFIGYSEPVDGAHIFKVIFKDKCVEYRVKQDEVMEFGCGAWFTGGAYAGGKWTKIWPPDNISGSYHLFLPK